MYGQNRNAVCLGTAYMGVSLLNTKHEELVDQLHLRLHYDPLHQNDQNSILGKMLQLMIAMAIASLHMYFSMLVATFF